MTVTSELARVERACGVARQRTEGRATRLPSAIDAGLQRDLRVDFFRGLALLFIFIDHIPGNVLSNFTLHSIAFSDAAEVFVFISGYTAALAYGNVLVRKGFLSATLRIFRRVWQLYVAHIFVFTLLAAFVMHHALTHSEISAGAFGLSALLDEPQSALINALLLQYQPSYLDILPLYIVLLGVFPVALYVIARHPLLALAPSALLYLLTQLLGWEVHGYPGDHVWFFNPLAWQFLFVAGAVLGYPQRPTARKATWLAASAGAAAAFAAAIKISWAMHFDDAGVPGTLLNLLGPYAADKTDLNALRLISFLALALIAVRFMQPQSRILRGRVAGWLISCGQNSLHVFCLGILLSVFGLFALKQFGDGIAVQLSINVIGGALMVGMARLLAWGKTDHQYSSRPSRWPQLQQDALLSLSSFAGCLVKYVRHPIRIINKTYYRI